MALRQKKEAKRIYAMRSLIIRILILSLTLSLAWTRIFFSSVFSHTIHFQYLFIQFHRWAGDLSLAQCECGAYFSHSFSLSLVVHCVWRRQRRIQLCTYAIVSSVTTFHGNSLNEY